jgi:hypothetical protein
MGGGVGTSGHDPFVRHEVFDSRRDRKPGGELRGGCGRTWLLDPTGGEAISRGAARRRARSGQDGPGAWRAADSRACGGGTEV